MLRLVTLVYNDPYSDKSGRIYRHCDICTAQLGHAYRPGNQPGLPFHAWNATYYCKCSYTNIDLGNVDVPTTHTHSDLTDKLDSFTPWLDDMEATLSTLAQTLLDLRTQCAGP